MDAKIETAKLPSNQFRTTLIIGGHGCHQLENINEGVIVVAGEGCGCHDSDNGEGDVVTVQLPRNPSPGQSHFVTAGPNVNVLVNGGCFDICGSGSFVVPACSENQFRFVPNKVGGCCGCGKNRCGCASGVWVPQRPSPTPDIAAVVADLEELSELDFEDLGLGQGALVQVASLGGALFALDLASAVGINGTTVVATNIPGVGRFILTPTLGTVTFSLPLPPPAV